MPTVTGRRTANRAMKLVPSVAWSLGKNGLPIRCLAFRARSIQDKPAPLKSDEKDADVPGFHGVYLSVNAQTAVSVFIDGSH